MNSVSPLPKKTYRGRLQQTSKINMRSSQSLLAIGEHLQCFLQHLVLEEEFDGWAGERVETQFCLPLEQKPRCFVLFARSYVPAGSLHTRPGLPSSSFQYELAEYPVPCSMTAIPCGF